MKFEIKSRIDGKILFSLETTSFKLCIEAAVKSSANLSYANLSSANLSYANLSYADLSYANLSSADLSSADLSSANLRSADLRSADLRSAKNTPKQTAAELLMCPEEGDFIGWKKCSDGVIAKLLIPAKAARSSATSRKCRAEFVKVLALFNDGKAFVGPAETNTSGNKTIYAVGKTVKPDKWDADRWNECSNGIHFFITRTEAENY